MFDCVNHSNLTFRTTKNHHARYTFILAPLLFSWLRSGPSTFLILESPLVRRIFARISQTCPKSCATFAYKFSPTKIMNWRPFLVWHLKKPSFVFLQTLGAIFAQIFRDFAQTFDKSKLLGVILHPRLLHHCLQPSKPLEKHENKEKLFELNVDFVHILARFCAYSNNWQSL